MAVDVQGKKFAVGQKVARAMAAGPSAYIEVQYVTKVDGDKVYLADSTRPMRHPERLCILDK